MMIEQEQQWTELISRYLSGNCTPEESDRLLQWVADGEDHERMFSECEMIWKAAGRKADLSVDMDKQWSGLLAHLKDTRQRQPVRIRKLVWRVAAAAAIILILVLGYRSLYRAPQVGQVIVHAESAEPTEVTLPDGTTVWLRDGSEIGYAKEFTVRDVRLKGEGYFEVTHDPERSFRVETGATVTRVLGTKFNLKEIGEDRVELLVIEGRVAFADVSSPENGGIFTKDQAAVIESATGEVRRVNKPANLNTLSWMTGRLSFDHEPLTDVVADLEMHFNVQFIVDPGIGSCTLKSDFHNATLTEVLETICFSLKCNYTNENGVYHLRGNTCNTIQ